MSYQQFKTQDGTEYGSFEVFYLNREQAAEACGQEAGEAMAGWYWQACFPGCLPDGEPIGPFDTEAAATEHAISE